MHPIILKTFGGLSTRYYFRQFMFGLLLPALIFLFQGYLKTPPSVGDIIFFIINCLLYPYSRFVYESIVNFILGDNVFIMHAALMLFIKIMTMTICWVAAIFIAPVGLAYLYYHHSKADYN